MYADSICFGPTTVSRKRDCFKAKVYTMWVHGPSGLDCAWNCEFSFAVFCLDHPPEWPDPPRVSLLLTNPFILNSPNSEVLGFSIYAKKGIV